MVWLSIWVKLGGINYSTWMGVIKGVIVRTVVVKNYRSNGFSDDSIWLYEEMRSSDDRIM